MKKLKKIIRITFSVMLSLFVIAFIAAAIIFEPSIKINGYKTLDNNKLSYLNNMPNFTAANNEEINEEVLASSTLFTPSTSINENTINAFTSIEDRRFYKHKGVDFIRIAGALSKNIKHKAYKEGGSTISQQLIKNTHLSNDKTIKRKIQEVRIARELERMYTKDDILLMYLNCIYFGNGIYGIGTASRVYFGKDATTLTLDESAMLAGLINNPVKYCPYLKYQNCIARRNLVLNRMLKNKKISKDEYTVAVDTNTVIADNSDLYDHYFNNAIFEAANLLGCDIWDIKNKKYIINSYYDSNISKIINKIYNETEFSAKNEVDFSCLVLDNNNMSILAFYGTGRKNYPNYNRSPASTIKPIIAYAPALEKKMIYPISPILDEKKSFRDYSPNNYMDKYLGWISVEDSLVTSSNIIAVKLLEESGLKYSKSIAEKMGLTFEKNDNNLALALGGMENGLSLQQVANAYQTFASGGVFKKCSYIKSINDENGNVIYSDSRLSVRAISEETAFFINSMLEKCVERGTARQLKGLKNVAAKTGTSGTKDGNSDAYCISYNKDYTVAVWIGAKKEYMPNYISGGTLPSKINNKIFTEILDIKGSKNENFCVPNGIEKLYVDREILEKEHKVVLANDMTSENHKIAAFFDVRNLPNENSIKYFNKYLLYKDMNIFSA